MKFLIKLWVVSLFLLNSVPSWAAGCKCLCSLFYTRGGEKKLCSDVYTTRTKCENWYHDIFNISNAQDCRKLGESINECKGNFKENTRNADWTLIEGGRFHSCRLIEK
ncbi:MAG: hypothetical protein ACKOA8_00920 [Deltaproteobacteria bacterium]|jgi:hypothetical protein